MKKSVADQSPAERLARCARAMKHTDWACLKPKKWLNATVIDCYLQYVAIESSRLCRGFSEKVHIFNPFFFTKLAGEPGTEYRMKEPSCGKAAHGMVAAWSNGVDIFKKDFVLVPINTGAHWNLAIICYPARAFAQVTPSKTEAPSTTRIVVVDSLTSASGTAAEVDMKHLKEYLLFEYCKVKGKKDDEIRKTFCERVHIQHLITPSDKNGEVLRPPQTNSWDCGIYLLHYAKIFFTAGSKADVASANEAWPYTTSWHEVRPPAQVEEHMRQEIQDGLRQYATEHQGQQKNLTPESDPHDCVLQEAVAFEEDVLQAAITSEISELDFGPLQVSTLLACLCQCRLKRCSCPLTRGGGRCEMPAVEGSKYCSLCQQHRPSPPDDVADQDVLVDGWPAGPWHSREAAIKAFKEHARDGLGEVVFSIRVRSSWGGAVILECCCAGENKDGVEPGKPRRRTYSALKRTGCEWHVRLTLTDGKWFRATLKDEHNHEVMPRAFQTSNSKLQYIPDDYWNRALQLRYGHQNMMPSKIYSLFCQEELDASKGQLPFERRFLENKLQAHPGSSDDAKRLVYDLMDEKRKQPDFILDVTRDETTHALVRVFWSTPEMILAARSSAAPLLLDATYSFTKTVLKLVVPATVSTHNTTNVIAGCLIFEEDKETWTWLLDKLKLVCGFHEDRERKTPLSTIICDEDRAMAAAIDAQAQKHPGHFHRHVCTYHLGMQTFSNYANMIFARRGQESQDKCQKFVDTFWRIQKETDMRCRRPGAFEEEWDFLMDMLPADLTKTQRKFFERIRGDKERWACRYTWSRMIAGMSASSRIEGVHGELKGAIASGNKLQLCQVPCHIQAFINKQDKLVKISQFSISQWCNTQGCKDESPFLDSVSRVATPSAVDMVKEEWRKSQYYNVTLLNPENKATSNHVQLLGDYNPQECKMWLVLPVQESEQPKKMLPHGRAPFAPKNRLILQEGDAAPWCTCQGQIARGLPCRHLLAWQRSTNCVRREARDKLVRSWVSPQWLLGTEEVVKRSMMQEASAALMQVVKDYRAVEGEEAAIPGDFATWDAALRKASALAWSSGRQEARIFWDGVNDMCARIRRGKQGDDTKGNPAVRDIEVANPQRGRRGTVGRKKSGTETAKRRKGDEVKCGDCGLPMWKKNLPRHQMTCRNRTNASGGAGTDAKHTNPKRKFPYS